MNIWGGVSPSHAPLQTQTARVSQGAEGSAVANPSFGEVLGRMISDVDSSVRAAEKHAIGALTGNVPLQKAVESVVQAEQKVQLTTAVRDKIVAAYLELSRMQI
ncbi:MAG TPA: flagellar hook-basal body complex protein FliE [Hyphomicrobium sp.]|nr:flagellar hook-basal body complex protein FliE [Hyphomicrobium sp.]